MPSDRVPALTGGCQCGAVRYALYAVPERASICHCRMCQKQFGGYFGPLASVPPEDFAWTRGMPSWFRSSQAAQRGFCAACGTPLAYQVIGEEVEIALGSLDDPARVPPTRQVGLEGRLSFFAALAALPGEDANAGETPEDVARLASRQHPDHDTQDWPQPG